jgi:hypothetical protein
VLPDPVALVLVPALDVPLEEDESAPAAGRSGSVTSMYEAPADPASASTAVAAIHFAERRLALPK